MAKSELIRILTVDDHPLLLEGLSTVICTQPDMVLVGEAFNGVHAVKQFAKLQPDVTLIDLRLPDMSGIDGMLAIREQSPEAKIIVMTNFESDSSVQQALEAGAHSYILKNMLPREIIATIRDVNSGCGRALKDNTWVPLADAKLTEYQSAHFAAVAASH